MTDGVWRTIRGNRVFITPKKVKEIKEWKEEKQNARDTVLNKLDTTIEGNKKYNEYLAMRNRVRNKYKAKQPDNIFFSDYEITEPLTKEERKFFQKYTTQSTGTYYREIPEPGGRWTPTKLHTAESVELRKQNETIPYLYKDSKNDIKSQQGIKRYEQQVEEGIDDKNKAKYFIDKSRDTLKDYESRSFKKEGGYGTGKVQRLRDEFDRYYKKNPIVHPEENKKVMNTEIMDPALQYLQKESYKPKNNSQLVKDLIDRGYSPETAEKMAREIIKNRKKK